MTKTLDELIAQDSIISTITQLFIATDDRNWPAVQDCFTSSVWFDMSSAGGGQPTHLAPSQIVAAWDAGLKPLKAIHHQAGNFIVRVSGNQAEAFCYGIASHYLPNKSNQNTRLFVGSYDFGLLNEGGRWKISKFKFNLKYIDGNPNLEAS
jgi:hypothetical protein